MNYLAIATTMIGAEKIGLPEDLINRLNKVDLLTSLAGGELRSRQIVAVVIQQWLWDNPKEVKKFWKNKRRKNDQNI